MPFDACECASQLGEVKHSLGETETALQKLRNDHTELEKRRVSYSTWLCS